MIPGVMSGLLPLPRFRIRQITHSAILGDGQTLLLGNPTDQSIFKKRDGTVETTKYSEPKKKLFVFVTPRLIDETGNPIHGDEEMPFSKDSIPAQLRGQK